jgi:hypothetical protein
MSRPLPGHRVQLDVKFIQPLPARQTGARRKHDQFTAIDDCTRLRVLRIYPKLNQKTAIQFLDYVLERLPFSVEVIQTDNGVEFGASFHWHVLDKGIGHDYIKPRPPRLNGKVERSHRIDAEEFYQLLDGVVIDNTEVFNDKLREWENFYNYHRPHGGLGGQTPYERLKQRTQTRVEPATISCTPRSMHWCPESTLLTLRAIGDGVRSKEPVIRSGELTDGAPAGTAGPAGQRTPSARGRSPGTPVPPGSRPGTPGSDPRNGS